MSEQNSVISDEGSIDFCIAETQAVLTNSNDPTNRSDENELDNEQDENQPDDPGVQYTQVASDDEGSIDFCIAETQVDTGSITELELEEEKDQDQNIHQNIYAPEPHDLLSSTPAFEKPQENSAYNSSNFNPSDQPTVIDSIPNSRNSLFKQSPFPYSKETSGRNVPSGIFTGESEVATILDEIPSSLNNPVNAPFTNEKQQSQNQFTNNSFFSAEEVPTMLDEVPQQLLSEPSPSPQEHLEQPEDLLEDNFRDNSEKCLDKSPNEDRVNLVLSQPVDQPPPFLEEKLSQRIEEPSAEKPTEDENCEKMRESPVATKTPENQQDKIQNPITNKEKNDKTIMGEEEGRVFEEGLEENPWISTRPNKSPVRNSVGKEVRSSKSGWKKRENEENGDQKEERGEIEFFDVVENSVEENKKEGKNPEENDKLCLETVSEVEKDIQIENNKNENSPLNGGKRKFKTPLFSPSAALNPKFDTSPAIETEELSNLTKSPTRKRKRKFQNSRMSPEKETILSETVTAGQKITYSLELPENFAMDSQPQENAKVSKKEGKENENMGFSDDLNEKDGFNRNEEDHEMMVENDHDEISKKSKKSEKDDEEAEFEESEVNDMKTHNYSKLVKKSNKLILLSKKENINMNQCFEAISVSDDGIKDIPTSFLPDSQKPGKCSKVPKKWSKMWEKLSQIGWFWTKGRKLVNFFYVRPDCQALEPYKVGVHYFCSEEEVTKYIHRSVVKFCRELRNSAISPNNTTIESADEDEVTLNKTSMSKKVILEDTEKQEKLTSEVILEKNENFLFSGNVVEIDKRIVKDIPESFLPNFSNGFNCEIPGKWPKLWTKLEENGWYWTKGRKLVNFYYIRPGCKSFPPFTKNEDFFVTEDDVINYVNNVVNKYKKELFQKNPQIVMEKNEHNAKKNKKPNNSKEINNTDQTKKIEKKRKIKNNPIQQNKILQSKKTRNNVLSLTKVPWKEIWSILRDHGWSWDKSGNSQVAYYFIPNFTGSNTSAVEGKEKFRLSDDVKGFLEKNQDNKNIKTLIQELKEISYSYQIEENNFQETQPKTSLELEDSDDDQLEDGDNMDVEVEDGENVEVEGDDYYDLPSSQSLLMSQPIENWELTSHRKRRRVSQKNPDSQFTTLEEGFSEKNEGNRHNKIKKFKKSDSGVKQKKREVSEKVKNRNLVDRVEGREKNHDNNNNDFYNFENDMPTQPQVSCLYENDSEDTSSTKKPKNHKNVPIKKSNKIQTSKINKSNSNYKYEINSPESVKSLSPTKNRKSVQSTMKSGFKPLKRSSPTKNDKFVKNLFNDIKFVVSGISLQLKEKLISSIMKSGGTILEAVPVFPIRTKTDNNCPPLIVLSHPKEFRKPNYMVALATGVPLIHFNWVTHSITSENLLPLTPYLLPSGCSALHPHFVFPPIPNFNLNFNSDDVSVASESERDLKGVLHEMKVLNMAGAGWDKILLAAGAVAVTPDDGVLQGLSQLGKKGFHSHFKSKTKVDVVLVDPVVYTCPKKPNQTNQLSELGLSAIHNCLFLNENGNNDSYMGDKRFNSDSENSPAVVSTDWVVHCLALGYVVDFKSADIFTLPQEPETTPFTFKNPKSGERYCKYDLVYFKQDTEKPMGSTENPLDLCIGSIISFSRRTIDSPMMARILPFRAIDAESETEPTTKHSRVKQLRGGDDDEQIVIDATQLEGKVVLLSKEAFEDTRKGYSEIDKDVFYADSEWVKEVMAEMEQESDNEDEFRNFLTVSQDL